MLDEARVHFHSLFQLNRIFGLSIADNFNRFTAEENVCFQQEYLLHIPFPIFRHLNKTEHYTAEACVAFQRF